MEADKFKLGKGNTILGDPTGTLRNTVRDAGVEFIAGLAVTGYSLYRYLKYKKPPGATPALLVPALTAFFFVSTAPTLPEVY